MSDKMRGALFNILGDLSGLRVLDAFAGSGALAFEAISRGAKSATLIDNDRLAQRAIERNILQLGIKDKAKLVTAGIGPWLNTSAEQLFDIVLCDPPYDDLQANLLLRVQEVVRPDGGLLVLSWPGGKEMPVFGNLQLVESKQYGDSSLSFYRR